MTLFHLQDYKQRTQQTPQEASKLGTHITKLAQIVHHVSAFSMVSDLVLYSAADFFLNPFLLHGFLVATEFVFLLIILISWVSRILGFVQNMVPKKNHLVSHKRTLFSCKVLSLFNLFLCLWNQFSLNTKESTDGYILVVHAILGTIIWSSISLYLHSRVSYSPSNYPFVLRFWWVFFSTVSCYCLMIDYVHYKKTQYLLPQFLVSDAISAFMGLFLCYFELALKTRYQLLFNCTFGHPRVKDEIASPYAKANIFSILTFSWVNSLIAKGNKKPLDLEDVPEVTFFRGNIESSTNGTNQITTFGLTKKLSYLVWTEVVVTGFLALIYTLSNFVGPYLIDTFVQYLNGRRDFENQSFVLVATFFGSKIVGCFTRRHWFFRLEHAGIRVRAAIVAMIYQKALTLSIHSKHANANSSGQIINFVAVDAEKVGDCVWYLHDLWLVVVQVGVVLALLCKTMGISVVASLVGTILVLLANVPLGRLQKKLQDELMKSKDRRMKETSEAFRNMRILKLQGWEMKFLSKIVKLRDEEAETLKRYMYTMSMSSILVWGAPTFVAAITFSAYTLIGNGTPLESGKVLSALAIFKLLQEPICDLPNSISAFFQAKISLDRIASFLSLNNIDSNAIEKLPRGISDTAVEIINGTFAWDVLSPNPTLKNIDINLKRGMQVAICGAVGSGKSSLLSCILGEVPKISGTVKLQGTNAYVSQSPWIQSGNIRDNILFGKGMDRERYNKVLEACCLTKDLQILSFGDQTVIGERGVNLSGGQKQRIQIARAIYHDADIYLFDDPFSSLDAHTGSHLFKECMMKFLDSKTVIYVTHQVEFLHVADLILVMKGGRITQAGKYNDILNPGSDFMDLVGAHKEALSTIKSVDMNISDKIESCNKIQMEERDECSGSKGQLVQEEEREKGGVGFIVYWKYLTAAYGGALVPFIFLAQLLVQILQIGSNYWMVWASPISTSEPSFVSGSMLIIVYVAFAVGCLFCILLRCLLVDTVAFKTATQIFHKFHLSIFRSPMAFFDSTPSGRILNRASSDQSAVDMQIPYQFASFAFSIIQLLGVIIVMSQVTWHVFFMFFPVLATCMWLQEYYLPSAREMVRLIGLHKGLVIQSFAETISGTTTIRSFGQQDRFKAINMKLNDDFSRIRFHSAAALEWLGIRLDLVSSLTYATFLVILISIPKGTVNPSVAGLAVTYGFTLNMLQGWLIWNLTNLKSKIISVERIFQYISIPNEPPLVIESRIPDRHWPSHGEVDILDLQVQYAPHMPLVLRGLTCTFKGGLKTGIVGRTGSGKSTLIQTLFRIVEPASGQILIDDVDISTIGLHDLRCRLGIIPQDPIMFDGTIRSNLDPLEEYADEQIWEALDKCYLGDKIRNKEEKLESSVTENGENWSMGQRQLICLGRVLLKKTKILVLDEATASVDTTTDNMIQQTLGQQFTNSTIIMVAHRITSVVDSDMIMVLEQGLIKEYDSPTKLLEDKASSFAKLVAEYAMRSNSTFEI